MLFELCDKMSQLPNLQVMPCLVTIPSAPFNNRSLVPTWLGGTPSWMYDFPHPCLFAFWHPICLLAPHLPFGAPICLLAPIPSDVHFQL
jgi:hypothetical protein